MVTVSTSVIGRPLRPLPAERAAAKSDNRDEITAASEDEEDPMETDSKTEAVDVPMETEDSDEEDDAVAAAKPKVCAEKAVASGLPQNKAELESLIKNIHKSVQTNILPRLHSCLTAKVRTYSSYPQRNTCT